ncbi:MAG: prepilin-type N-terminal cleavage/methylation domain-containing protein [Roseburia sp.]
MTGLKKNKNAGFSLIEVLIAMAIFTVCLVPLLRSFVVVSSTNAKSRQILNASTVAENIIEEIKAEGVTSYVSGISPSGYVNIDGVDFPAYTVTYNNRTYDGKTYKAEVTLTPSNETYNDGGTEKSLNTQDTAELYTMSNKTDAFYVEETNALNSVALDYVQAHPDKTVSEVVKNIETEYTFTISDVGGVQSVVQTVTRDYNGVNLSAETKSIFSSLQTGNELKSLYIFYVPASSGGKEQFIIDNRDNYPVDVYIVQQSSIIRDASLTILETGRTSVDAPTTIRTNMDYADFDDVTYQYGGSTFLRMSKTQAEDAFGFHTLGVIEEMDGKDARLYNIEAHVYDVNGNELTSLTGTALR